MEKLKKINDNPEFSSIGKQKQKLFLGNKVNERLEKFDRIANKSFQVHAGSASISMQIDEIENKNENPI